MTGTYPTGEVPIDETFQLGNGGWEILSEGAGHGSMSATSSHTDPVTTGMSLTEHTDVYQSRATGVPDALRGVPDTYSARLGVGVSAAGAQGFRRLRVGGRINGVTVRTSIGGGDLYWRRPGYEVYVEPGLTWTSGPNIAPSASRFGRTRRSWTACSTNRSTGTSASDFAPFLILASYAHRF